MSDQMPTRRNDIDSLPFYDSAPAHDVAHIAIQDEHDGSLFSGLYESTAAVLAGICFNGEFNKSTGSPSHKSPMLDDVLASYLLWGDLVSKAEALSTTFLNLYRNVSGLLLRLSRNTLQLAQKETHVDPIRIAALEVWVEKASFVLGKNRPEVVQNDGEGQEDRDSDTSSQFTISVGDDIEDIYGAMSHDMSLLMELAPSITSLAKFEQPHQERVSSVHIPFETSEPARYWISQVADKYTEAPPILANRLGEANWQRFCKLRRNQDEGVANEYGHAKSIFHDAYTNFHDSALGTSRASASDDKQSNASHSSFASSAANDAHHFNKVPREPPEVAAGEPFVCGVCNTWIDSIRNRTDWKIHVFADLQPYICLFEGCERHLQTFPTRSTWAAHDQKKHRERTVYRCWDCNGTFTTQVGFRSHIEGRHPTRNSSQLNVLVSAAAHTQSSISTWDCPLCSMTNFTSARKFTSHVCRHMEDIALSTLPRSMYDSDSDASDRDSISELEQDDNANAEKSTPLVDHRDTSFKAPEVPERSSRILYSPVTNTRTPSPTIKKHKCPYCDTEFTRMHNLQSHLLTHSQEKPYICATCNSRFRRLHDLKRHTKLHTTEKLLVCPKCNRKFVRADALARHTKGPGGCAGRPASIESSEEDIDTQSEEGIGDEIDSNGEEDGMKWGLSLVPPMPRFSLPPWHEPASSQELDHPRPMITYSNKVEQPNIVAQKDPEAIIEAELQEGDPPQFPQRSENQNPTDHLDPSLAYNSGLLRRENDPMDEEATLAYRKGYRACEPCRQRKARCDLVGVDNVSNGPCARCTRLNRKCWFKESKTQNSFEKRHNAPLPGTSTMSFHDLTSSRKTKLESLDGASSSNPAQLTRPSDWLTEFDP